MAKYVNSQEVRERLGCTRQFVHIVATRENWGVKDGNRPYYYLLQDVETYLLDRDHTERAKTEFNKSMRGLIRHDANGYNQNCPVCKKEK